MKVASISCTNFFHGYWKFPRKIFKLSRHCGPDNCEHLKCIFSISLLFFRAFCLAIELIHYVYLFAICKQFVAYQQHLNDDKNKNVLDYFRYYLSVIKYVYRVRRCMKGKIKRIRYIFFTNFIYIFKCVTHTL